jgi:hypothetical protein
MVDLEVCSKHFTKYQWVTYKFYHVSDIYLLDCKIFHFGCLIDIIVVLARALYYCITKYCDIKNLALVTA